MIPPGTDAAPTGASAPTGAAAPLRNGPWS
jgi:hypothetical protein